jgi:hypothetical protein
VRRAGGVPRPAGAATSSSTTPCWPSAIWRSGTRPIRPAAGRRSMSCTPPTPDTSIRWSTPAAGMPSTRRSPRPRPRSPASSSECTGESPASPPLPAPLPPWLGSSQGLGGISFRLPLGGSVFSCRRHSEPRARAVPWRVLCASSRPRTATGNEHARTVEIRRGIRGEVPAAPRPNDKRCRRTTVSREPEDIDQPGHGPFGAPQDRRGPTSTRRPDEARSWVRRLRRHPGRPQPIGTGPAAVVRWFGRLRLLDSWSPANQHPGSPRGAWCDVLVEWTRSGDLTVAQAAALLALDEATPWEL